MAEAAKADMFAWEGTDKTGKRVKGEMTGQSESLVKASLRRQGIKPLKVKKKSKPLLGGGGGKITPNQVMAITNCYVVATQRIFAFLFCSVCLQTWNKAK